ncbi:hypothetical protein [Streptosporangium carneum]|uniref:Uncharacterized protein n=1 Tax=Streptosporangium carneum TaxID=47481 RepID=A0A9W6HWA5_9ACTN|nr:hypothetical protein [Streptosporangium carneum]GLK06854.1 hypothetical protein GCM10017600_02590 [Streptosporangium carneum]
MTRGVGTEQHRHDTEAGKRLHDPGNRATGRRQVEQRPQHALAATPPGPDSDLHPDLGLQAGPDSDLGPHLDPVPVPIVVPGLRFGSGSDVDPGLHLDPGSGPDPCLGSDLGLDPAPAPGLGLRGGIDPDLDLRLGSVPVLASEAEIEAEIEIDAESVVAPGGCPGRRSGLRGRLRCDPDLCRCSAF